MKLLPTSTIDDSCPHCGKSLRGKLLKSRPFPGQSKILPIDAYSACPFCSGGIKTKEHPAEIKLVLSSTAIGVLTFGPYVIWGAGSLTVGILFLVLGALAEFALWRVFSKQLAGWKRYEPFVQEK